MTNENTSRDRRDRDRRTSAFAGGTPTSPDTTAATIAATTAATVDSTPATSCDTSTATVDCSGSF